MSWKSCLHQGQILVPGCLSMKLQGGQIEKASNIDIKWSWLSRPARLSETSRDLSGGTRRSISIGAWWLGERPAMRDRNRQCPSESPCSGRGWTTRSWGTGILLVEFISPIRVRHRRCLGGDARQTQVPIRPILRELGWSPCHSLASRPKLTAVPVLSTWWSHPKITIRTSFKGLVFLMKREGKTSFKTSAI